MRLHDHLRTWLGIRMPRQIAPAGPQPKVGSNIVFSSLRIQLKYPISAELWDWFSQNGWRAADLRKDRREYSIVSDKTLQRLLSADVRERDAIHRTLMKAIVKREHGLSPVKPKTGRQRLSNLSSS